MKYVFVTADIDTPEKFEYAYQMMYYVNKKVYNTEYTNEEFLEDTKVNRKKLYIVFQNLSDAGFKKIEKYMLVNNATRLPH